MSGQSRYFLGLFLPRRALFFTLFSFLTIIKVWRMGISQEGKKKERKKRILGRKEDKGERRRTGMGGGKWRERKKQKIKGKELVSRLRNIHKHLSRLFAATSWWLELFLRSLKPGWQVSFLLISFNLM